LSSSSSRIPLRTTPSDGTNADKLSTSYVEEGCSTSAAVDDYDDDDDDDGGSTSTNKYLSVRLRIDDGHEFDCESMRSNGMEWNGMEWNERSHNRKIANQE